MGTRRRAAFFTILVIFWLALIKVSDLVVGEFSTAAGNTHALPRSINLREFPTGADFWTTPSDRYMRDVQGLEQKPYRVRTDRSGFIVGPGFQRQDAEADIVFFGGSTTECLYVDEDVRFPHLVGESLESPQGAPVVVLNGGIAGNNAMHSVLNYLAKGITTKPKFVVLMHGVNDVLMMTYTLSYWSGPRSRMIVQNGEPSDGIVRHGLKSLRDVLIPNIWPVVRRTTPIEAIFPVPEVDEWADFRDERQDLLSIRSAFTHQFPAALRSFIQIARQWGAQPVLMTQFNRFDQEDVFVRETWERSNRLVSFDEFVSLYALSNEIVRNLSRSEEVPLIDLDAKISGNQDLIYDAVHLNARGSVVAASEISRFFSRNFPGSFSIAQ